MDSISLVTLASLTTNAFLENKKGAGFYTDAFLISKLKTF